MSIKKSATPPRRGPMGGPMGGAAPAERAKDFKGTLKKLIHYLGGFKIAVIIVMLCAIGSAVFGIMGPKILGSATTELFNGMMNQISGAAQGVDFGAIASIMLWLAVIYLTSMLFSLVQGLIMTHVSNKITYNLRRDIDDKIHRLPFSYYDTVSTGDVLSHITNDVDAINQGLNQSITQIISSATMLVGILVMMLSISWQMTLIALITLPLSMLGVLLIAKKSQKHFIAQQEYLGRVNGMVEENYSCHNIVKAFNGEEKSIKEFASENTVLYSSAWKANFLSGLMMPIMNFIGNIGYVAVCVVGGAFAAAGTMTVGNIQAFIQYMRNFTQPIAQLSQISNVIQQTIAASERVFIFLNEKEDAPDVADALRVAKKGEAATDKAVQVEGRITFDHVSFGYVPEKIIVNDFSAEVKPGQKIAIVGPTGAGKSTMVKLLMRFYDVNTGKILLDGRDIRDYGREDFRTEFGMVLQETWLFGGTIADNIRYGKLDATLDEVKAAARVAQADRFIRTLPGGYDMVLNEEASNVSQGQKQLLTIARAVLADPKVLILDEATSSVDTKTEGLIQKAMDNLMMGRTSFIIAHRLSTIRNADTILVMKDGDIIEQGSHNDLIAQNGFYAALYNSQFAVAG